ncbi:hypothetical protein Bbelb_250790 [Branchiostoma belcheri]|nr:hypothetical protein Bbelb_250790 [Branchiostoma belcheri]
MFLRQSCAVFWIWGEEIADFLTWWILEKTRKWRPKDDGVVVGRAEFSQVSCVLRVCQLCKCSCPDEMAEAPGDQIQEYQASSGHSCLNLAREDWTRPDDLKTQEEYQLTAVMILNPTRPDVHVLRNLVTGNFSPAQTSKSDDLKTHYRCVLSVSYPGVPVLTGRNL